MSINRRVVFMWALVGFVTALLICALAFYLSQRPLQFGRDTDVIIQQTFLILCPPSIGLMAIDYVQSFGGRTFVVLVIALKNAALYALVGAIFSWLWQRLKPIS